MSGYGQNGMTPWTAKFLVVQGNCLRLNVSHVTSGDLKMIVVAPDARAVYRASDGGTAGPTAPMVQVAPATRTGFYTVVITSEDGLALATDFHLQFGQYPAAHASCANPTAPL
jgi:hypothetical protein